MTQARQWQAAKQKPTQTGDWKNTPGKASSGVVERSADYFKKVIEEAISGPVQDTSFGYDTSMVKPYVPTPTS